MCVLSRQGPLYLSNNTIIAHTVVRTTEEQIFDRIWKDFSIDYTDWGFNDATFNHDAAEEGKFNLLICVQFFVLQLESWNIAPCFI